MKFLGMNIAPMLNPLKFSITTPLNSQNMQTELTAVQVFWNLALILIRENWFSSKHFFAVSVIVLYVSGADLYLRAVMFQQLPNIQERFPTHRWVFLTLTWKIRLLPNCVTLWSTWMIHGSDWLKLSWFKSGVAGFLRTTEVTRGNDGKWWHIRIFMPCCWLSLVTSRLII